MYGRFYVMHKDDVVCIVDVPEYGNDIKVEKVIDRAAIQPFYGGKVDRERIYRFFARRCFEENRPDRKELLASLGLTEYNPYEIVRKTHGVNYDDYLWVRFPGEENLHWEDVKIRD